MLRTRIIPVLLLKDNGLVKTVKFRNPRYIGDPINAVRIFNDKGADELIFLDIQASVNGLKPDLDLIKRIANESFMPFGYGGGIRSLKVAEQILKLGCEKIIINSYVLDNPNFITKLSNLFGSQSVVVSIDFKKNIFGKNYLYGCSGKKKYNYSPAEFSKICENLGAGEIIVNSIDRDGTYEGYDIKLLAEISSVVNIPVVALGGASSILDFKKAKKAGTHAVAAGSLFVFAKKDQGVLINYPQIDDLEKIFN